MRRLKQKEITTDKPAKGDQPMRSLRATTPLTTCRTKRKSRRYQQRRNK